MQHLTQFITLILFSLMSVACQEHPTVFIEVSTRDDQAANGAFELGVNALVRGGGDLKVRLYASLDPRLIGMPDSGNPDSGNPEGGNPDSGDPDSGDPGTPSSPDLNVGEMRAERCRPVSEWVMTGRGLRSGEPSALAPTSEETDALDMGSDEDTDFELPSLEPPRCVYIELEYGRGDRLTGASFDGLLSVSPAPLGLEFAYRLRASGDAGVTWWPQSQPLIATVEGLRAPLTLTHIAPRSGPSSGETHVLIKGSGFSDMAPLSVTLGGRALTQVRVESPHLISAYTPAGTPEQSGTLRVISAEREAILERAYYWTPPPRIDEVTPRELPELTSAEVLLRGAHFVEGTTPTQVFETSVELDFTALPPREIAERTRMLDPLTARVLDSNHLLVTVPPMGEGTSTLIALNPDGQSAFASLVRRAPPVLFSVTPASGPDNVPTWILLEGSKLQQPATVWFDGRRALGVEVSSGGTRARVKTPLHPGGLSDIVWYNPDGQSATLNASYRFLSPPRVSAATPTVLSRCGGGTTTLVGINLTADMRVYFNGVEGEVLSVNDEGTEASVRAPPSSSAGGTLELELIGVDGRGDRRVDLLEYGVQPLVREIEPARAPVWGGTSALIRGSDLIAGSTFRIGDREVERARFLADGCDSIVEVIIPEGDSGLQTLSVGTEGAITSVLPEAIDYVAPEFDPPEGLNAGYTNVALRGLDLREGLRVSFNGIPPRAVSRISDEEWRLLTPNSAVGLVEIELRNVDGRGLTSRDLYRATWFVDQGARSLNATGECNHVAQGDLNGDGILDLVLAMGASSPVGIIDQPDLIYFGDGQGLSAPESLYEDGNGMNVYFADVDDDLDLDILLTNLFSERNFLLLNDGQAGFTEDLDFPALNLGPSYDAGIFDVDLDGDLDLFFMQTGDVSDNQVFGPERLYLREGEMWVERSGAIDFDLDDVHDHDMAHGDLNNDGLDDIVIVVDNLPQSFPGASNRVLLNRGEGRFERVNTIINNFPGDWLDVVLADINGDGNLDILMPQDYIEGISVVGTPAIALFIGDGMGGFTDESFRINGFPPVPAFGVTPYDLDRDGDLDLLLAVYGISFGDGSVDPFESAILLNDGDGQFFGGSRAFNESALISTSHFEVIDLDRDGRVDMVECAAEGQSRVWRQQQE